MSNWEYPEHDPGLARFFASRKEEIDAAFVTMKARLIDNMCMYMGPPEPPAPRWSRRWWRARWYAVRSVTVRARRSVGMWVGGIDPRELDCDC